MHLAFAFVLIPEMQEITFGGEESVDYMAVFMAGWRGNQKVFFIKIYPKKITEITVNYTLFRSGDLPRLAVWHGLLGAV